MSSHVVVIDSTARRATVKTTPSKHLVDVLHEACAKLALDASQFGLKHKSKQLDLSLSVRLAGVSSGAKLELVQLSRSPAVVTVALQLPEPEAQGTPNGRLLDKFPSSTTLWLVLRKFEAGVAGNGKVRNLTARGVSEPGAGGDQPLYYETPVLNVMGRELGSFTDLQKTLAQLGFNSGNVLLRLSFRRTEELLEDAMLKIEGYFKSLDDLLLSSGAQQQQQTAPEAGGLGGEPSPGPPPPSKPHPTEKLAASPSPDVPAPSSLSTVAAVSAETAALTPSVSSRLVTVYSPPSAATPQSALSEFNEMDYVPSLEHAQVHQRRLNQASRPTRLPTDAEIAAKAAAEQERLSAVKETEVKVRFPDQSQIVTKFGQADTGKALYEFVRGCLVEELAAHKFTLTFIPSVASTGRGGGGRNIQAVVPESDSVFLIREIGMVGRVLVNFSWGDAAGPSSLLSRSIPQGAIDTAGRRGGSILILKPELSRQAQDIKVEQVQDVADKTETDAKTEPGLGRGLDGTTSRTNESSRSASSKMPKWLKLPGKK